VIDASAAPVPDSSVVGKPVPLQADEPAQTLQRSLGRVLAWVVFTVGLAWFLYAGTVRVGAGHWLGQRLRVQVIWSRFLAFLADHGANSTMVGLVVLTAALTLLGSLGLLWWVMGQRIGDAEPPVALDEA